MCQHNSLSQHPQVRLLKFFQSIFGFFFPKITNSSQDIITYFFPLSMVAWMIDEFGSEELRERFVPELASMQVK